VNGRGCRRDPTWVRHRGAGRTQTDSPTSSTTSRSTAPGSTGSPHWRPAAGSATWGAARARSRRTSTPAGSTCWGADISEEMLRQARRLHPSIEFRREDMLRLGLDDGSLGGIVAFYAIVNFSADQVDQGLRECRRVLAPGGRSPSAIPTGTWSTRAGAPTSWPRGRPSTGRSAGAAATAPRRAGRHGARASRIRRAGRSRSRGRRPRPGPPSGGRGPSWR
jgi:SAM-dependent methyltransferase